MNALPKLKYVFGLLAIITGAVATFDNSLMPLIRYLVMYMSLLVISWVLLHSMYMDVDNNNTLEKAKEER